MKIDIVDMDNLRNPFWAAGQARATFEVSRILAKHHTVTVHCSKYPGYSDYVQDGVSYVHHGVVVNQPQITNAAFILSIPFIVSRIHSDVIIENFNAPFSVSFSPLFTKIPVIALPTMFNAEAFSRKYFLPFWIVEAIGMKFYRYMMPFSTVGETKAKKLNRNIITKIIPEGVGPDFFAVKPGKSEYILFLGRFDIAQKGIDLLLKAYARIKEKINYPLVVAGHGSDKKKIEDLIQSLGLTGAVQLHGAVYGKDKMDLISRALFVAFPSRHDEMSIWALEALAAGLPLVGFDIPECEWAPNSVALKAEAYNVPVYADSLLRAAELNVNKKMRHAAREFARSFTWEHVASEIEAFIIEVIKHHGQK
ncbi:MAG: glycosyltransferase [Patescibacteria group bacterium]|jgi:glycosyltransferase involved in cell wall biosynthesis